MKTNRWWHRSSRIVCGKDQGLLVLFEVEVCKNVKLEKEGMIHQQPFGNLTGLRLFQRELQCLHWRGDRLSHLQWKVHWYLIIKKQRCKIKQVLKLTAEKVQSPHSRKGKELRRKGSVFLRETQSWTKKERYCPPAWRLTCILNADSLRKLSAWFQTVRL